MSAANGEITLLYDGECGLCSRIVQFVLRRDRADRFRFAPLQSELAARVLARHGREAADLDTFYLVFDRDGAAERMVSKGRAAIELFRIVGGIWTVAVLFSWVPTGVLDWLYDRVATNRYRLFGRAEGCLLPTPEHRAKFLA